MFKITKKKVATLVVVGSLAVGVPLAYSYWTTDGSGTGTGSTTAGLTDALSFTQDPLSSMYPGDAAQTLTVTVENTSTTESAYVETVKAYITTDKSGCTGADFLLGNAAAPVDEASAVDLAWTAQDLVAGGTADATGTIQFRNTAANQDACKSATVTINYIAA